MCCFAIAPKLKLLCQLNGSVCCICLNQAWLISGASDNNSNGNSSQTLDPIIFQFIFVLPVIKFIIIIIITVIIKISQTLDPIIFPIYFCLPVIKLVIIIIIIVIIKISQTLDPIIFQFIFVCQ